MKHLLISIARFLLVWAIVALGLMLCWFFFFPFLDLRVSALFNVFVAFGASFGIVRWMTESDAELELEDLHYPSIRLRRKKN